MVAVEAVPAEALDRGGTLCVHQRAPEVAAENLVVERGIAVTPRRSMLARLDHHVSVFF